MYCKDGAGRGGDCASGGGVLFFVDVDDGGVWISLVLCAKRSPTVSALCSRVCRRVFRIIIMMIIMIIMSIAPISRSKKEMPRAFLGTYFSTRDGISRARSRDRKEHFQNGTILDGIEP